MTKIMLGFGPERPLDCALALFVDGNVMAAAARPALRKKSRRFMG
jgi:hypothetical protein